MTIVMSLTTIGIAPRSLKNLIVKVENVMFAANSSRYFMAAMNGFEVILKLTNPFKQKLVVVETIRAMMFAIATSTFKNVINA